MPSKKNSKIMRQSKIYHNNAEERVHLRAVRRAHRGARKQEGEPPCLSWPKQSSFGLPILKIDFSGAPRSFSCSNTLDCLRALVKAKAICWSISLGPFIHPIRKGVLKSSIFFMKLMHSRKKQKPCLGEQSLTNKIPMEVKNIIDALAKVRSQRLRAVQLLSARCEGSQLFCLKYLPVGRLLGGRWSSSRSA